VVLSVFFATQPNHLVNSFSLSCTHMFFQEASPHFLGLKTSKKTDDEQDMSWTLEYLKDGDEDNKSDANVFAIGDTPLLDVHEKVSSFLVKCAVTTKNPSQFQSVSNSAWRVALDALPKRGDGFEAIYGPIPSTFRPTPEEWIVLCKPRADLSDAEVEVRLTALWHAYSLR